MNLEIQDYYSPARKLLRETGSGILSTHSADIPGYPFGSVVVYALDKMGHVIILISHLAQHYKNIVQDNKVSLTVMENGGGDAQKKARLTYIADAIPLMNDDSTTREAYFSAFPDQKDYESQLHFIFFRLNPVKLRFIQGMGKIRWLEPARFFEKL